MSNNPFLNPSFTTGGSSSSGRPRPDGTDGPYSPPDHPPDSPNQRVGLATQTSGYAPTTTPTTGQPLLLNGQMLVYPNGWQGCAKCGDTGYKRGDPANPCRRCWQSYGQRPNPLLISASGLQGAKVLQRPLPLQSVSNGASSSGYGTGSGWGMERTPGGYAGHQQPQSTGGSFQTAQSTGAFRPPTHPPTGNPGRRRSPPQVTRAEDAGEDNEDGDGEAPPAYADAVAAGPGAILPPQRRDNQGRLIPTLTGASTSHPTASSSSTPHPQSSLSNSVPGSFTNAHSHHHPHQHHRPPPQHPMRPAQPGYGPMTPSHMIPYGHVPPPGALVLQPGDPRIGGHLCYKCRGRGLRDSLWWGEETCHHCGGSGRIL